MGFDLSKSINLRILIYFFALSAILLYSLVLTGCISESPGIPNIFLVELISTVGDNTRLRINYLAMCSITNSSGQRLCFSTVGASSSSLALRLQAPEDIIQYGLNLQLVGFPVFLASGGVFFVMGVVSFLLLKMTTRAPSNSLSPDKSLRVRKRKARYSSATEKSLWLSSVIVFAVAYATTLTTSTLILISSSHLSVTSPRIVRGTTLEVLQWLIFATSFLFSLGISRLIQQPGLRPLPVNKAPGQNVTYPPPPAPAPAARSLPPPPRPVLR